VRLGLTDNEVADLAISRDGKHAVYSHQLDDQNIWSASLDGQRVSEPVNLIASTRRDTQARYSPDGKRIAFESDRSGNEEVWLCNADGSDPVQLTYFGNAWAGAPKWSPDGQKIAFAANPAGNWDIYIVSSGGGRPTRFTGDRADESWPTWSRDGKWIYYFSNRGQQAHIWKMRSTGGPEIQVTKNAGYWSDESVDGKDLYYMNEAGLWRVPSAGGDAVWVGPYSSFAPARNGVYCAYTKSPRSQSAAFELRFLDSKTHQTKTLGVLSGPLGWNINISPDEHRLLYSKFDREGSELMLIENFQ
jgi:Tol biopolymer transport system component